MNNEDFKRLLNDAPKPSFIINMTPKHNEAKAIQWDGVMNPTVREFLQSCASVEENFLPGGALLIKFYIHDYMGHQTSQLNRAIVPIYNYIVLDCLGNYQVMDFYQLQDNYNFNPC